MEYIQASLTYTFCKNGEGEGFLLNIIQQFVNKKLNGITAEELMNYSKEYDIAITAKQCQQVVTLMKGQNINIYDVSERIQLIKKIADVTSLKTAQQVNALLQNLVKQ